MVKNRTAVKQQLKNSLKDYLVPDVGLDDILCTVEQLGWTYRVKIEGRGLAWDCEVRITPWERANGSLVE